MTTTNSRPAHTVRPDNRASRLEGRAADLSVVLLALTVAVVLLVGGLTMEVRGTQVPGPQFFPFIVSGLLFVTAIVLLVLVLRPSHDPTEVDAYPNISRELVEDAADLGEIGPRAIVDQVRHPHSGTLLHGSTPVTTGQAQQIADGDAVTPVAVADTDAPGAVATGPDTDNAGTEVVEVKPAEDPDTSYPLDWRTVGLTVGAVVLFIAGLNLIGWILSAALLFWVIAYAFGSKRPILDIGIALLFSSVIQLLFSGLLGLSLPAGFVGGLF